MVEAADSLPGGYKVTVDGVVEGIVDEVTDLDRKGDIISISALFFEDCYFDAAFFFSYFWCFLNLIHLFGFLCVTTWLGKLR